MTSTQTPVFTYPASGFIGHGFSKLRVIIKFQQPVPQSHALCKDSLTAAVIGGSASVAGHSSEPASMQTTAQLHSNVWHVLQELSGVADGAVLQEALLVFLLFLALLLECGALGREYVCQRRASALADT